MDLWQDLLILTFPKASPPPFLVVKSSSSSFNPSAGMICKALLRLDECYAKPPQSRQGVNRVLLMPFKESTAFINRSMILDDLYQDSVGELRV
jgi:hypothetical protein